MNRRQKKKIATQLHGPHDFRKELSDRPRYKREVRTRTSDRWFNSLFFNGDIEFSIQASVGHYCVPRETTQVYAYEYMEVAFFKDGRRAPIHKITKKRSIIREFEEYQDDLADTEDFSDCVYAFVPVPLIQKLYADILLREGRREYIAKVDPLRDRIKRHKEKTNSNSPSVVMRSVTQEISNDFWRGIKDGLSKIDEVETSNDFNDQAHV